MSPRPRKPRRCGCPYWGRAFKPTGRPMSELVHLPIERDEVEVLRLCDLQGLTQEQAGAHMGVSRGTVQRLLAAARAKVARAVVEGCALVFAAPSKENEP